MLRSLIHHRRSAIGLAAGCAVTTAVLTGALMVGDSVRGSMRAMTLDRLGRIGTVVLAERRFDASLAGAVPGASPIVLVHGSAVHGGSGARATRVQVLGVEEGVFGLWPDYPPLPIEREPGAIFPAVALNASLARELGAAVGDDVVLTFQRYDAIPRESLMGDAATDAVLTNLRVTVSGIVPDRGPGRFGLSAQQQVPRNAFLEAGALQRALGMRGGFNALLVPEGSTAADVARELDAAMTLADHGLRIENRGPFAVVESDGYVLRPEHERAVIEAAHALALPAQRLVSYLANGTRAGARSMPYSGVTGVDAAVDVLGSRLFLESGSRAPALPADGIYLSRWAADDLRVVRGDEIEMSYFVVGSREQVREVRTTFRVAGVVSWEELGGDRDQAPEFPGFDNADDIASWDPPFPVDLDRVRAEDESYWDERKATPKAFVALPTAERLWATRYGATTQVRVPVPDGGVDALGAAILERLDPGTSGLTIREVRSEGLDASEGATDFAGLFLGFSWFLIVAAAMLVGLLFALGIERRAREIGVRLAVGFRVRKVRAQLLGEGMIVGVVGAVAGAALALVYAALMMAGLRTLWIGAVGSTELALHVVPATVAGGVAGSLVVILIAIVGSVLRLSKIPPPRLLQGDIRKAGRRRAGRVSVVLAWGGSVGAIALVAIAAATGRFDDPGLAFGAGALLLVGGLAWFARWCRADGRRAESAVGGLGSMAARNASWNPGRSLLSVALVACAAFVLVLVAASRQEFGDELDRRDSGTGGYALLAESDLPLLHDLNTETGRIELGLDPDSAAMLRGISVQPLRLLPGDDASCLNLYRPESPRLVGLPDDFLDRGGFRFRSHAPLPEGVDDPWALLSIPFDDPEVVPAVADTNSAQWILKLGLGDDLTVEDEGGRPLRLRLVGLLDTSVFQSEILIAERPFLDRFPSRTGYGAFLVDVPRDRAQDVAERLEDGLRPFGVDAISTRARIEAFKAVEHTYLSTFQLLGGLGLLLGTVGLAIVMVRNVFDRRAELATLRAFGFTRQRVARMVLAENAFLLIVGVGLGAVAALLAVLPRLAHVDVPWTSLVATLAAVFVVGLVSAVAAVRGAMRVPLLPELKAER